MGIVLYQNIHHSVLLSAPIMRRLYNSSASLQKSFRESKPPTPVLIAPKSQSFVIGSSRWDLVVGLEVHAQLATHSKLFSSARCQADFGRHTLARVNSLVAPFDAAFPGTMPVSNLKYKFIILILNNL